jgi:DNA-binding transcriptional LysR family regulator
MDRIDYLRIFLSVAEKNSFSEAARHIGISAGQVSKQIAALETRLKTRLFDRSTRRVRLTPEGEQLIEKARIIVDNLDAIETGHFEETEALTGLVRITVPVVYGAYRIAPLITRFMEDNPSVSVRLSLSDRKTDLIEEGFDLAIRIGKHTDLGLIGRKLADETIRIVASHSYLQKFGVPQTPEELQSHECLIDTNPPEPRRWRFSRGSEEVTVRVDGRFESDSLHAVTAAAQAGLGIAQLPCWCTGQVSDIDNLKVILGDWDTPVPEVWILWPPGRYLPARVRLLIDFISTHLPRPDLS